MDHDHIDNHHLIDRYLNGRLEAAEAEAFGDHLLGCQGCLDEIETAERMRRGMMRVAEEDTASLTRFRAVVAAWWTTRRSSVRLMTALVLTLIVSAPALFVNWRARALRDRLVAEEVAMLDGPRANVPILHMSPLRDGAVDQSPVYTISGDNQTGRQVMVLEIEADEGTRLKAVLTDVKGAELWTVDELIVDDYGEVALSFSADRLAPKDYTLTLTTGDREVARFIFRIISE